jgi:hypothetical protein
MFLFFLKQHLLNGKSGCAEKWEQRFPQKNGSGPTEAA